MKRILYLVAMIVVMGHTAALGLVTVESGDVLEVHITDSNGTDIISGTYTPVSTSAIDPHEFTVSPEGTVYITYVGTLSVNGKTTAQIADEIKQRLEGIIKYRDVAVLIASPKTNRVYVLGEVLKPGMYQVDITKPYEMKLMNLVSKAGGFTDRANREQVHIIGNEGQEQVIDLDDIVLNCSTRNNVTLRDRDTIIVPQALSRVYVLGEVTRPGGYSFIHGAGFADYIAEAGGITTAAAGGNIGIVRRQTDNKAAVYKVSLDGDFVSRSQKELAIEPGDIVYVPRSMFADWKDIGTILGLTRDYIFIYDRFYQ